jgi:hypothetical protein
MSAHLLTFERLYLGYNLSRGALPVALHDLHDRSFGRNAISGPVPESIGSLTELTWPP